MNPDIVCTHIATLLWDKPEVQMTQAHIDRATEWAIRVYNWKVEHHERVGDRNSFIKREVTGRLGEMALEILLGILFCDWSVGSEEDHSAPDLRPIGIEGGVKSSSILVEIPNVPLVPIVPRHPQVITVLRPNLFHYEFGDLVSICGVATLKVMMNYSHRDLIRSRVIRKGNWKTGFYGFEYLIPFFNLEELRKIFEQIRTNNM